MLRITRETDYGIVLLTKMAKAVDHAYSAAVLARQCHLPAPMASKILKTLAQAGLLVSQRGARGGYSLARPPAAISVAEVIEALEGPIAITECSTDDPDACVYKHYCGVNSHWNRINEVIRDALEGISLAEMTRLPSSRPASLPVNFHNAASMS